MQNSFHNMEIHAYGGEKETIWTAHESKHFEGAWSPEKLFGDL